MPSMKCSAMKGLFCVSAMIGVVLQGCGGCNEAGSTECSSAITVTDCASAQKMIQCVPDNGCCSHEEEANGIKISGKAAVDATILVYTALYSECSLTNPCG